MLGTKGMGTRGEGWGSGPKMAISLTCEVPRSHREEEEAPRGVRGREKPTQQSHGV